MTGPSTANPLASQIGYAPTTLSPASATLTLLAGGHAAGLYGVSYMPVVRTDGTATITPTLAWNAPTLGAQSRPLPTFVVTLAVALLQESVSVMSDGSAPITLTCASGVVVGAPIIDLYGAAALVGS